VKLVDCDNEPDPNGNDLAWAKASFNDGESSGERMTENMRL
jgi:hypothetical protein